MLDVGSLIVNANTAVESHPAAFVKCAVYVPLDEYVVLFQSYDTQLEIVVVLVVGSLIVNANTAVESHPAAFVNILV